MSDKYAIHSDFAKIPVINIKFSRWLMGPLNGALRLHRWFGKRSDAVTVEKHRIERRDGSRFKVMVMTPKELKPAAPALVYYHGGAFAMTYAAGHLDQAEYYAEQCGCVVVFVDYRLGPQYPFPHGFDDCYAALQWSLEQAAQQSIDPQRIAVGGDSAGGALAAGVAQKARDEQLLDLCGQLLIYPVLDHQCQTDSARAFVDTPLWNAVSNKRMWEMYLKDFSATPDFIAPGFIPPEYAAPGHGELQALAPAYIETAEFDPLRDEGLAYARALEQASVNTQVNATRGSVHGYDAIKKSQLVQDSLAQRVGFLQKIFSQ